MALVMVFIKTVTTVCLAAGLIFKALEYRPLTSRIQLSGTPTLAASAAFNFSESSQAGHCLAWLFLFLAGAVGRPPLKLSNRWTAPTPF
jgi:hypothetical protein